MESITPLQRCLFRVLSPFSFETSESGYQTLSHPIVTVVSQTDSWLISCPAGNDPWHFYDSHSMVRVYLTCEAYILIGEAITPTNSREVLPSAWTLFLTVQGTSKVTVSSILSIKLKIQLAEFFEGKLECRISVCVCACVVYV